jgi:hypothetical protein
MRDLDILARTVRTFVEGSKRSTVFDGSGDDDDDDDDEEEADGANSMARSMSLDRRLFCFSSDLAPPPPGFSAKPT